MSIRSLTLKSLAFIALGAIPMAASITSSTQSQFQQPTVIPTGSWPASIATADVNGDGKADLIYTDYGATATASTTHILLGNGDGTFTVGQTIPTAGSSVAVADFDQDGSPDLEWVWSVLGQGKVFLAKGNGDGTFAAPVGLGTFAQIGTNTPQLSYLMGARLHDTGYLDLLVEDVANSALFELTADSSGTLVRLVGIRLADGAGPMATADLDSDGHTDLVIQGITGGAIDVFLGSANGILQTPTRYRGVSGVQSMLLHDVDADGHPDLLIEGANGHLDILHGFPDGSFATISEGGSGGFDGITGFGGHLVAVTDVMASNGPSHRLYTETPSGMSVLKSQTDLSLTLQGIYNCGPGRTSFVMADFNSDGVPDIAVDSPEGIAILFGNADGSLKSSRAFSAGKPALSGALGVFTISGYLDAVVSVAATQAQLLRGNGDGTFTLLSAPTTALTGNPVLSGHIVTGDFNGDGKLDLAITQNGSNLAASGAGLSVQYGNGNGTFGAVTPLNGSFFGTSISADLNGDGVTDLANVDAIGDHVLFGQTSGGFTQNDLTANGTNLVASGDLNHDGKADLVYQSGTTWTVYLNGGNGLFAQAGILQGAHGLTGLAAEAVTIADLDGDGNGDLVVAFDNASADHAHPIAALSNSVYIWYGKGDGTFDAPVILTPSRNYYQVAAVDLDGDGQLDLVMSDGYVVSVQRNQGNRSFGAEQHLLAGMGINAISVGDVNTDGATDLVVANGGSALSNPAITQGALAMNQGLSTGGVTVLLNTLNGKAVGGILTAAPSATAYGQSYTITASVKPLNSGPAATGMVTFAVDGVTLGTVPVTTGVAAITAPGTTPIGTHVLTAQYSGDSVYGAASLSGSHSVTGLSSSVVLTITTPATIYYGQTINGYAQVTASDNSALNGTITFYDGSVNICVIPVTQMISCPASSGRGFAVGTHVLTATYSGDTTHSGSTSNAVSVTVLPDTTTANVASSLNPSPSGQSVVFTATIHGSYAVPAGAVTFMDGTSVIGTAMLSSSGVASLATSSLAVGTHNITASYSGDGSSSATVSAVFSQVVNAGSLPTTASFTIDVGSISIATGKTASVLVKVSPMNGFNQAVQLGCSDLPSEATCNFASSTIPAGGGTTTLQLSTLAPRACGSSAGYSQTSSLPLGAPVLAGLVMLFLPKRRRAMKGLLTLIAMCGFIAMTGCGACTDLGTKPGTYTIKVTGTSNGVTQATTSQKVQVTVGE